jgi:leucyl aminopeptidase
MRIEFTGGSWLRAPAEALAVGVFEDLNFKGAGLDERLAQQASRLRFKGKEGEAFFAFSLAGDPPKHLLVVGLGKRASYGPAAARAAAVLTARRLASRFVSTCALRLPDAGTPARRRDFARAVTEGLLLGNARFDRFLTDKEDRFDGFSRAWVFVDRKGPEYRRGAEIGRAMAEGTLLARRLVNEPANVLTPERMAEEARMLAEEGGLEIQVFGPKECRKMGMGAYLAVAQGSANPPRFLHLSYRPKGARFTLGLVGKGLTFDSGGLSLKPADHMGAMKSDMAGSAAVLGALKTATLLKPKVAVEAVMAMCENMPDGSAYRPGDILTSMSGKTIEVQNTDAEGRLTLADALCYVQKQKVDAVLDLATLTGACVVALGPDFSGAMGNDQKFMDQVLKAAKEAGDEIWQLPLPAAYGKYIKSDVADVSNMSRIRWGGAITAGLFLQRFIENDTPWVHLDIAGPSLRDDDGPDAPKSEGSGVGVRTIAQLLLDKASARRGAGRGRRG